MTVVDLTEARRFLALLDPEAERWCFRTFPEGVDGPGRNEYGALDEHADRLQQHNASGRGVFVVVNRGGQADDDITLVRAVFADFDPPQTAAMPEHLPLEPHFIVESSRGKHHAYWLVDGMAVADFKPMQQRIAAALSSDPSVTNPSRVMRLPGFIHRKPADKAHDGQPFVSRVIHESGALSYTPEALQAAFPAKAAPKAPPKPAAAACSPSGVVVETNRHDDGLALTGRMARAVTDGGMSEAAAWTAIEAEAVRGRWTRPMPELRRMFDGALRHIRGGTWESKPAAGRKREPAANDPIIGNAADLLQREFLPVQWGVRGILPEGISILSGDPKIGKSWLLYQACIAVASGQPLWPGREPEEPGDALMLALEDNDRRLQRRLLTLLPRFTAIEGRRLTQPNVSRLHYATEWPRAEAGVQKLDEWLTARPEARIVVIDTVGAFRQKDLARNKSAYAADYEVGEMFKPLARKHSCAIVLVMHNRKQHSEDALQLVSGTQGMTGGVDNVIVLRRERGHMDAGLYVDGRDIEEPQEIALRFDNGYWAGSGQTIDQARMSAERREVLRIVDELGDGAKSRAICEALVPKKAGTIRALLAKMVKAGDLHLSEGLYSPPGTVETTATKGTGA